MNTIPHHYDNDDRRGISGNSFNNVGGENNVAGPGGVVQPPPRTGARVRDDFISVPAVHQVTTTVSPPPIPILEVHCADSIYRSGSQIKSKAVF